MPVFEDGPIEVFTCPVLAFTPDIEQALAWFASTHELQSSASGLLVWHRVGLPAPGSDGEQDARLMHQLRLIRTVGNQILGERFQRERKRQEYEAWCRRREAERG